MAFKPSRYTALMRAFRNLPPTQQMILRSHLLRRTPILAGMEANRFVSRDRTAGCPAALATILHLEAVPEPIPGRITVPLQTVDLQDQWYDDGTFFKILLSTPEEIRRAMQEALEGNHDGPVSDVSETNCHLE